MMSPVPTPLMGFSSLKPQGQEWTHRPIFNYLPEQDQDPLHQLLACWHQIFNPATEQAEKWLRLKKTGQLTHLPGQTFREQSRASQ